MTLRELQEAEILKPRGAQMGTDIIEDRAKLDALEQGALFQDQIGVVWQKNSIRCTDVGHGNPVDIYNMVGGTVFALPNQILDWTPLTVLVRELPVAPAPRTLPRGTIIPVALWHEMGVNDIAELDEAEARLQKSGQ